MSELAPIEDDGFAAGSSFGRSFNFLKWTAAGGWVDRDGTTAPSPLLIVKVGELLRRWQDSKPNDITTLPLPDPKDLNAEIPEHEWELGLNGEPRPPWEHCVNVVLVDPKTATKYQFTAPTIGSHICVAVLKESVSTMRQLRGQSVLALAELSSRPMKMKFGQGERPHLEIISWHLPGVDMEAPATAQLSHVEPATSAEIMDDEIPLDAPAPEQSRRRRVG